MRYNWNNILHPAKIKVSSGEISFWERDVGQDMFLADKVGSCISLSNNASAGLQFLLDQGTHNVLFKVPEQGKEDVKAYARIFLGMGFDDKVLIYVDTEDGRVSEEVTKKMKLHAKALAKGIGLSEDRIFDRKEGIVKEKLGGVLLDGYFEHTQGAKMERSEPEEDIDGWKPDGGWDDESMDLSSTRVLKENDEAVGGIKFSSIENMLELESHGEPARYFDLTDIERLKVKVNGFIPVIVDIKMPNS